MLKFLFVFSLCLQVSLSAFSSDIWVSTSGNDAWNGTLSSPKASLNSALRQAREWRRLHEPSVRGGITIHLMPGTYPLYEPIFIRPEDSGTDESPTRIVSERSGPAVLSGGLAIVNWKKQKGKLWVADVPECNGNILNFRQLWVNGQKAVRARDVEDFERMHRIIGNDPAAQILWVPTKAVQAILKAPRTEMVLHEMWCVANLRIKSIEVHGDSSAVRFHTPESRIQFEHPWPRPMVTTDGHNSGFYLTNAIELLDRPGEWFYDIYTRKIYYYPCPGENMRTANAVVPTLETLVQVEGTLDNPVTHIRFENLSFEYTTWLRPSEKGHVPLQGGMFLTDAYTLQPKLTREDGNHPLDNQGWLGRPPGAIQISGADDVDFQGCRFQHLASSGLDYVWGDKGGRVEGCLFEDIGGNGLVVGNFSPASHETHKPYDPADRREVCSFQWIANNVINNIGNEDWGCLGILAGYVCNITIQHNEIFDVPYSGISLGWGWTQTVNCMRNNLVRANHIHHYAKNMYDVAGIYTLGSQPKSYVLENAVHSICKPGYAHDPEHWFYLYTDEGSSFITVKDNWTEGEKFIQNANGPGNVWQNNGPQVNDSIRSRAGLQKPFKF